MKKLRLSLALIVGMMTIGQASNSLDAGGREDKPIVVWDGETAGKGGGWTNPKDDANSIKPDDNEFKAGKKSIAYHAEGNQWLGCGWNWHAWFPAMAGTDISGADHMEFWIKVTGKRRPSTLSIHLVSNNQKATTDVKIEGYLKSKERLDDGEWHRVSIPLNDMYGTKNEFDPKLAWEFDLGEWSPDALNFTVYMDSVRFTKS